MGIAPVVDAPPLLVVELSSVFKDDALSIIPIYLPPPPTCNVRAEKNKKLSNYPATYKKLLDIVESLDKPFIKW